jgi:hypothetical protein
VNLLQPPDLQTVSEWCDAHVGARTGAVLFETGFSSHVVGVRLVDAPELVLKLRRFTPRLRGTAQVQAVMWSAGFPCPQVLVPPTPYRSCWISAESLVHGGHALADDVAAPELYAPALAQLVGCAPAADRVSDLVPPPPWLYWSHSESGLWPRPESNDVDLNTLRTPA